jgi:hypothetical protein
MWVRIGKQIIQEHSIKNPVESQYPALHKESTDDPAGQYDLMRCKIQKQ